MMLDGFLRFDLLIHLDWVVFGVLFYDFTFVHSTEFQKTKYRTAKISNRIDVNHLHTFIVSSCSSIFEKKKKTNPLKSTLFFLFPVLYGIVISRAIHFHSGKSLEKFTIWSIVLQCAHYFRQNFTCISAKQRWGYTRIHKLTRNFLVEVYRSFPFRQHTRKAHTGSFSKMANRPKTWHTHARTRTHTHTRACSARQFRTVVASYYIRSIHLYLIHNNNNKKSIE